MIRCREEFNDKRMEDAKTDVVIDSGASEPVVKDMDILDEVKIVPGIITELGKSSAVRSHHRRVVLMK